MDAFCRILCPLADLPEGASKGFAADPKAVYADILVVRTADGVYAYRNSCPHTGAPMEWETDQFLDYSGALIQCGLHGAQFRIEDGYCLAGPCAGRYLRKVAIAIQDGMIIALEEGIHLSRDTLVVSVGCVLRTNARGILLGSTKVRRTHPTDLSRLKLVALEEITRRYD